MLQILQFVETEVQECWQTVLDAGKDLNTYTIKSTNIQSTK